MFAMFQEGRTSTDQSDRKGLDGQLKNDLELKSENIRNGNCDEVNLLRCFVVRVLL